MPVKRHRAARRGCQASTKSGTRCAAPAVKGTRLCSLHADPERAAEIGRKGGEGNRKRYDSGAQDVPVPESPADVKRMLAKAAVDVQTGKMDPRRGTALAYMSVPLLKAMELSNKNTPPVYPTPYRGLANKMARVVRDEGALEKVAQQGLAEPQHALPAAESDVATRLLNEVEVAPGIYRY